ncbi:MAG: class I SAM-dependent methyltransferase [Chitinispirillaceae bacterium]|nr:class I SAM-dependent methyltransferase [Chitinispirillaceae bacterium]
MPHEHVCPWWIGYLLASPIRRLFQKPEKIVGPFIKNGMRILEIGPGMGFFTLPMAEIVGPEGGVIAVDIQDKMLRELRQRAKKTGLDGRIDCRLTKQDALGIGDLRGSIDFTLLMAVVHEVPDRRRFFEEVRSAMKTAGTVLMADPRPYFGIDEFEEALIFAREAGFNRSVDRISAIWRSNSALLTAG